jgi:hypothetical protein
MKEVAAASAPRRGRLPPLALDTGWRGSLAAAVLMAIAATLGFLFHNEIVAGLSLAGFVIAAIGAMLCGLVSWRTRPILHRLVTTAHFVCWHYSELEWDRHLADTKKVLNMTKFMVYAATALLATAVFAGLLEVIYRASVGLPKLNAYDAVRLVVPMSFPVAIAVLFGLIYDAVVSWYRRTMRRDGRVAYIGPDALYFGGQIAYAHLRGGWAIALNERAQLSISFEHTGYRNHQSFDIPVPERYANEALAVFEQVRRAWPAVRA